MIFEEESSQEYLFSVILAWTHARTISFIVDSKDTIDHQMLLIKFYHYCFYLSVLPSGPLILYKDFRASVGIRKTKITLLFCNLSQIFVCLTGGWKSGISQVVIVA